MRAMLLGKITIVVAIVSAALLAGNVCLAQAEAMVKMLQDGKIPPANQAQVIGMICDRGEAAELRYIFEQAIDAQGFTGDARQAAFTGLLEAAATRDIKPSGDLSGVAQLLAADENGTQQLGIELVGAWKVKEAAEGLRKLVLSEKAPLATRQDALAALTELGPDAAKQTVEGLLAPEQPLSLRYLGAGALASTDLDTAAVKAAEVLVTGDAKTDPAPMIDAFLALKAGPAKLAEAILKNPPEQDIAKMALRHMYAMGRSDKPLVDALSAAAGIEQNLEPLTPEQQQALVKEVLAKGDAARGEEIFRSAAVNCMKCHSVSGAGGDIGPDLSPLGTTSPPDYVIRSILYPKEAVKEEYITWTIYTVEGQILQGIIKEENEKVVQLKDANGKLHSIAVDDIDEKETTGSLMPEGLTNFLTHQEFLDLVRFVSGLGKPGPFAVRTEQTVQRWRVLDETPKNLVGVSPDEDAAIQLLALPADKWLPAYAKVGGDLPLAPLLTEQRPELFLYAEIEMTQDGELELQYDSPAGVTAWANGRPIDEVSDGKFTLETGRHKILLRVDPKDREKKSLRVVVVPTEGSTAEYTVVGGP